MDSLKIYIKDKRPNLSDGSLRTYNSILGNLYLQITGKKEIDKEIVPFFHKNPKLVIRHIEGIDNLNRRKTLLAGLVVICDGEESCDQYRKYMLDLAHDYKKNEEKQEMTESQRKNWVTQDEIKKLYAQLDKECRPYLTKDHLSIAEFNRLQNFVILSLYVLQAPRRLQDYTEFKLRDIDEKEDNYWSKNKLIFNTYKTAKRHGREEVDLNPKLKFILQKWKVLNPHPYLLMGITGKKFSSSQLQARLNSIFGKSVSVNILRHSYLTEKYKNIPAITEMKNTAQAMGHTLEQALEYVKRDALQDEEEKESSTPESSPPKNKKKRAPRKKIQSSS